MFFVPRDASGAVVVTGQSLLLTEQGADQVGNWLGQGDVVLTNIFSGNAASATGDFHSAADGKGATITVALAQQAGLPNAPLVVLGGYNPLSWNSFSGMTITSNDQDKTAFLFNLTSGIKFSQTGSAQTYNDAAYGPTFGGNGPVGPAFAVGRNNNLLVPPLRYDAGTLSWGYASNEGYGYLAGEASPQNLIDPIFGSGSSAFLYYQIEVFSITSAVPEPSSTALMFCGLLALAFVISRGKKCT